MKLEGPCIILNKTSTILVEPDCNAFIDEFGNVEINVESNFGIKDFKKFSTIKKDLTFHARFLIKMVT